jgi:hypothetical protein
MYRFLKGLIRFLIPGKFLMQVEFVLRYVYSFVYYGNAVECPVCGGSFSHFITLPSGDLLCPRCGSLPRQRRMWLLLNRQGLIREGAQVLHFSPSRFLQKKLHRLIPASYISTDFDLRSNTDRHFDITRIDEPAERFDLIICYHVLEHIPEDRKAISELFRIAKPGALILIQTPYKEGDTYEDDTITSPGERLIHFGQQDHVRIYSAEGLCNLMRMAGFSVEILNFGTDQKMGLKDEKVLRCSKPK